MVNGNSAYVEGGKTAVMGAATGNTVALVGGLAIVGIKVKSFCRG